MDLNKILKNNGIICFPTDTVWGIGCLPSSQKAVEKIYDIKGRNNSKPLILMSNDIKNLLPYIKKLPSKAEKLIEKHFPGALTLVLEKSNLTPLFVTSSYNTVGIRVPNHLIFKQICEKIEGHVLATTSANISNEPASINYKQAKNSIGNLVDLIIEDYSQSLEVASTVVSIINDEIKILRQGSIEL